MNRRKVKAQKEVQVVTKSQLATRLRLSKSTVSNYVARGLPTRCDGRLNFDKATSWIAENVTSSSKLSGWPLRRVLQNGAGSLAGGHEDSIERAWKDGCRAGYRRAVVDTLNQLRSTPNVALMARTALDFGCAPRQAYAAARWFDLFLAFASAPEDSNVVQEHPEPDWLGILGVSPAKLKTFQKWFASVLKKGDHVEPLNPEAVLQ